VSNAARLYCHTVVCVIIRHVLHPGDCSFNDESSAVKGLSHLLLCLVILRPPRAARFYLWSFPCRHFDFDFTVLPSWTPVTDYLSPSSSVLCCCFHLPPALFTRSSAVVGRPRDAKACQRLQKWTWKCQPRLKWPSHVLQGMGRGATGSKGSIDPPLFQVRGPHDGAWPLTFCDPCVEKLVQNPSFYTVLMRHSSPKMH